MLQIAFTRSGERIMDHFKLAFRDTARPETSRRRSQELVEGFQEGNQFETLLGVTGSGKTFTMANVIAAAE